MLKRIAKRIGTKVILTLVGLITVVAVYSVIGIYVNLKGVRIYDEFPEEFILRELDSEQELSCSIKNNAPLSLPFINPFYTSRIVIVDSENNASAYFINAAGKTRNFTDYYLDLGRIDSGGSDELRFFLCPDEGNVTFRVDVRLSFGVRLHAASKTYFVGYDQNYNYTISKTE